MNSPSLHTPPQRRATVVLLLAALLVFSSLPCNEELPPKTFIPNNARIGEVLFINAKFSKQFDLDGQHKHKLLVYLDVRNFLNGQNVRRMDSGGRIGGEVGDPSAYYDPRRVRVGVRWEF